MERPRLGLAFVIVFSALCFGSGGFTVDTMVPSLSLLAEGMSIDIKQAQLSISVIIFSSGVGQLLFGPLADFQGRRRTLIIGVVISMLGSIVCLFALNLETLLVGRFLQGFGASAPMVASRSILRDLYSSNRLAQMISLGYAAMGFLMLIMIPSSYLIAHWLGFRALFVLHLCHATVLLLLAVVQLEETIKLRNPDALHPRIFASCTAQVLRHHQSLTFILVHTLVYSSLFSWVISVQRVYNETYEIDKFVFPFIHTLFIVASLPGQLINQWLLQRYSPLQMCFTAFTFVIIIFSAASLAGVFGGLNVALFTIAGFSLLMLMMASVANTSALVLDPHGRIAGVASSLLGSIGFVVGTLISTAVAYLVGEDPLLLLLAILAMMLIALALTLFWVVMKLARPD